MNIDKEIFHEYVVKTIDDVTKELLENGMSELEINHFMLGAIIFVDKLKSNIFEKQK